MKATAAQARLKQGGNAVLPQYTYNFSTFSYVYTRYSPYIYNVCTT